MDQGVVETAGRHSLQIFMVSPTDKKSGVGRDEKCQGISFILHTINGFGINSEPLPRNIQREHTVFLLLRSASLNPVSRPITLKSSAHSS